MALAIGMNYFWPNLAGSCTAHLRNCDICLRTKSVNRQHGRARSLAPPTSRWERIQVDFVTALPESNGYNSVCVFTDMYTKRIHLVPCRNDVTAEQFADIYINTIVRHHGPVPIILSDRGTQFTSTFWKQASLRLGTNLQFATTDHHHTVGAVERANRTVIEALRALTFERPEHWHSQLAVVEYSINNAIHGSHGLTPFEADNGYGARRIDGTTAPQLNARDHIGHQRANLTMIDDALARAREITISNAKHKHIRLLAVGDNVLVAKERLATGADRGEHNKLHARYRGPYLIMEVLEHDNYRIQLPASSRAHNVFHISNLVEYTAKGNTDIARPAPVEGDDLFIVDRILKHRGSGNKRRYLVKWQGFPRSEATWEPISNLSDIIDMVTEYCSNTGINAPPRPSSTSSLD